MTEVKLCQFEEYDAGEKKLVNEADIKVNSFYDMMILLRKPVDGKLAARFTVKAIRKNLQDTGAAVDLAMVDNCLRPGNWGHDRFVDGHWKSETSDPIYVSEVPARTGYLMNHHRLSETGLQEVERVDVSAGADTTPQILIAA